MHLRKKDTGEVFTEKEFRQNETAAPRVLTAQAIQNLGYDALIASPKPSSEDPLQVAVCKQSRLNEKNQWIEIWSFEDRFEEPNKAEKEADHLLKIKLSKRPKDICPVYLDNDDFKWHLFKASYMDDGESIVRYCSDKQQALNYYIEYDEVTGFTTSPFTPSAAQSARFDEVAAEGINNKGCVAYISHGAIDPDTSDSWLQSKITTDTTKAFDLFSNREWTDQINIIRSIRSVSGIPFTVDSYQYTFGDGVNDLTSIKTVAADIKSGDISFMDGTGGYWKSIEGVEVSMTEVQFLSLASTITTYIAKLARESHNVKQAVIAESDKSIKQNLVEAYKSYDPLA